MRIVTLIAALTVAVLLIDASAQRYQTSYASGYGNYRSDAWMDRASRSYGGGGY